MDTSDCSLLACFNPRSHEGSDIACKSPERAWIVSIHAPTRGATYFVDNLRLSIKFQSTLPRGERLLDCQLVEAFYSFNPRSHEGSDTKSDNDPFQFSVSIHAPTRGATLNTCQNLIIGMFQSTLPRGERLRANVGER